MTKVDDLSGNLELVRKFAELTVKQIPGVMERMAQLRSRGLASGNPVYGTVFLTVQDWYEALGNDKLEAVMNESEDDDECANLQQQIVERTQLKPVVLWSVGKKFYRLDESLADMLEKVTLSEVRGSVILELSKLQDWAMYIELPRSRKQGVLEHFDGCFVMLDHGHLNSLDVDAPVTDGSKDFKTGGRDQLRLSFLALNDADPALSEFITLNVKAEDLQAMLDEDDRQIESLKEQFREQFSGEVSEDLSRAMYERFEAHRRLRDLIVMYVLYLNSLNSANQGRATARYEPVMTDDGPRLREEPGVVLCRAAGPGAQS